MFENITKFFKKLNKKDTNEINNSKEAAKERLHLVLMQDRANVSADFLELMKQEIIEVIKKYIDIDEGAIDVRLTNKENDDGTNGAPALYANIPIVNIKNEVRKVETKQEKIKESNKNQQEEQQFGENTKEQEMKKEQIVSEKNGIEEAKDVSTMVDIENREKTMESNEKQEEIQTESITGDIIESTTKEEKELKSEN